MSYYACEISGRMDANKANHIAKENYKQQELEKLDREQKLRPYREKVCRVNIRKAVEQGKFETECVDLFESNVDSLRNDGYKVKFVQHPLKWYYSVRW